jgi:hypothetical protein
MKEHFFSAFERGVVWRYRRSCPSVVSSSIDVVALEGRLPGENQLFKLVDVMDTVDVMDGMERM